MNCAETESLPSVVIPLLKGVVYRDEKPTIWEDLLRLQGFVRDYVKVLGLELNLDESEGYAFLGSVEEEEGADRPRLVARRQLSYPVSLVLALLRKKLAEFDAEQDRRYGFYPSTKGRRGDDRGASDYQGFRRRPVAFRV